jgi:peptide/nickel transport system permease protein
VGEKRITQEDIENWKQQHGYHLPRTFNSNERFPRCFTETIFWTKSAPLFVFRFGNSDGDDSHIGTELIKRIPYSLCIMIPIFLASLIINISVAMIVAFYRATYVDLWALVVCVIMMSISIMFYILGAQYIFGVLLKLTPVSGFDAHPLHSIKFLVLPILVGLIARIGAGIRYYRTVFLEEINRDYVRTARAKGLSEGKVLFKHVLKNTMLPILTNVIVSIPFLITGSLLLENFFGIPGLGSYTIEAIAKQDYAVVKAMVFLGSFMYVIALACVDISYTLVDPRVRLK